MWILLETSCPVLSYPGMYSLEVLPPSNACVSDPKLHGPRRCPARPRSSFSVSLFPLPVARSLPPFIVHRSPFTAPGPAAVAAASAGSRTTLDVLCAMFDVRRSSSMLQPSSIRGKLQLTLERVSRFATPPTIRLRLRLRLHRDANPNPRSGNNADIAPRSPSVRTQSPDPTARGASD